MMRINNIKESLKCIDETSVKMLECRKLNSNNTSGVRGVSYSKNKKKWVAYLKLQNRNISLGTFNTKEEAIEARLRGEEKYYKPIIEKYKKMKI